MNIETLYQDFSIIYYTEGKNVATGWINVQCPFCDDHSNHLGFNPETNSFRCWRCGYHPVTETISKILNVDLNTARNIQKNYKGETYVIAPDPEIKLNRYPFHFPSDTTPLIKTHKRYLEKRNFDPDKLEKVWNLKSTSAFSNLDKISYAHRIIIPINWNRETVSFQGRDITGKSDLKYKACPEIREKIKHKHVLGGKQESWSDTGIVCEGWFDVFRLGEKSCCTFGIEYTQQQVILLAKTFKRIGVAFDYEIQAQNKAKQLIAELKFRGRDAFLISIEDDPGKMDQDEADYLVKQIINH